MLRWRGCAGGGDGLTLLWPDSELFNMDLLWLLASEMHTAGVSCKFAWYVVELLPPTAESRLYLQ